MIRWLRGRPLGPATLAIVAWAVGAASAVAVGLVALSIVGTGLFGPADPLAPAGDPLPAPSATVPQQTAGPSATPAGGDEQTLTSSGGTVLARCVDGGAYLVLWSPAQGFHTDDVVRGPAPVARVTFEAFGREVKVKVTCSGGVPVATVNEDR